MTMTKMLHSVRFPGESRRYRRARNELLRAESELRRYMEKVEAQIGIRSSRIPVPEAEEYCRMEPTR